MKNNKLSTHLIISILFLILASCSNGNTESFYDSSIGNNNASSESSSQDDGNLSSTENNPEYYHLFQKEPIISNDNKTITYGLYPQTRITDEATILKLNNLEPAMNSSNLFYVDNSLYTYQLGVKNEGWSTFFNDGTNIVENEKYWFRFDPIDWQIIYHEENEYSLISKIVLDCQKYNESLFLGKEQRTDYNGNSSIVDCFNYQYSFIRNWLNTFFYKTSFCSNNCIINSFVDNSNESTLVEWEDRLYSCENTNDKIFLLSANELGNSKYGFLEIWEDEDPQRWAKSSDYACCRGLILNSITKHADYLTRSPNYYYMVSGYHGCLDHDYGQGEPHIGLAFPLGIRPAMKIKIN